MSHSALLDRTRIATALPLIFVCVVLVAIWSTYTCLHLLPMMQLSVHPDIRDDRLARRGFYQMCFVQMLSTLIVYCYCRCVLEHPGTVPDEPEWNLGAEPSQRPQTKELKVSGMRRVCKWCLKYKPDRCHHCRVCKTCVLRMDHHCPWIMNCVGFRNHKYFFLLVVYSAIACVFIVVTVLDSIDGAAMEDRPSAHRFLLLLSLTLSSIMGVLMVIFLTFHTWLMLRAMTTIEFCEKIPTGWTRNSGSRYNINAYHNIQEILGQQPLLWFLPVGSPRGSGVYFVSNDGA